MTALWEWGAWPCCCEADCLIFTDAFDRGDSATPANQWEEVTGLAHYDILDQMLRANANATRTLCINELPHPKDDPTGVITVDLHNLTVDPVRIALVVCNYVDLANYNFISYMPTGDGTEGTLGIWERIAGINNKRQEVTIPGVIGPQIMPLTLCRHLGGIQAWGPTSLAVFGKLANADNGGRRVGVGNDSVLQTVDFKNFNWHEHYATNPECSQCLCDCDGYNVSTHLKGVWAATGECAYCLDGVEVDLFHDWTDPLFTLFRWRGTGQHCPLSAGCGPIGAVSYELLCTPGGWENWHFWPAKPTLPDSYPSSGSCDPFALVFTGYWEGSGAPLDRTDYVFTVTEA